MSKAEVQYRKNFSIFTLVEKESKRKRK